uniref:DENN domain containing 6B n=1 Tax=Athene cunicularia TaxID=194338 RepID=A0A663M1H5_ATHCN
RAGLVPPLNARLRGAVGPSAGKRRYSFLSRTPPSSWQRKPGPSTSVAAGMSSEGPSTSVARESAHYFGYVYFRQVKDSSMKRGYFQKSLVLVSRLPYVNLFQSLLQLIAPEYFDKLEPCLEAVCNEIDQWPPPVPGQTLNLPVMGVVIQVLLGDGLCFQPVLIHIQMLWELMLLGEPIVVMAPSPTVSSEMVLALTSCLAPLRYCCDYRPYFTIHDSEFKEYTTRTQAPPNIVVGVTNPFFIKTLQHWPHILRVGELRMSGDLPKQVKVKKLAKLKTLDTKPGRSLCPTLFNFVSPSTGGILQGIQRKRPSEVQSALLRRHLLELTQSFIIPLVMMSWHLPSFIHPYLSSCNRCRKCWFKMPLSLQVRARCQHLPVKEETLQRVGLYIETIIGSLPEDLQAVLHHP